MSVYINYSFIKRVSQKWRWGVVVIYTLTIYISLPFGPMFWRFVLRQWGNSINYLGWFLVFVSGAYFLIHLSFREKKKTLGLYCLLFNIPCLPCHTEIYVLYWSGKTSFAHV